ncbi:MAG: type II toxin-antitoxin system death-on-curing family toxin [Acidobacteria bacterium]|nr:MAG: type II toxin-antitoxin system death-on-curing family toxin [Acidobacteriota bacterium]
MPAEIAFLSVEQVVLIHDEMLRRFGGSVLPGHRGQEEGVTAAVLAVENSYYDDLFELTAAYAVYIVMGHVFGDGNKRGGSGAALTFLAVNGIHLRARPQDLRDAMLEVQRRAEAEPRPATSELIAWMALWLRARKEGPPRQRGPHQASA